MKLNRDDVRIVGAFGVLLLVVVALAFFAAWQEAEAYRRATGHQISTWDALWLELRVESDASKSYEVFPGIDKKGGE